MYGLFTDEIDNMIKDEDIKKYYKGIIDIDEPY